MIHFWSSLYLLDKKADSFLYLLDKLMQLENIIGESLEFLSCLCLGSGLTLLLQSDTRQEEGLATLKGQ